MVALNVVHHASDGAAPPLVIAHGLMGSARNWGVIARRMADRGPVLVPDMRNHGTSGWSDDHSYAALADDLAGLIDGPADVLGHSMGGKAAMALALRHPARVRRLIVADIAPVAYAHTQMPMIDALRAVDLATVTSRRDADAQLAGHVPDAATRAFLLQSLDVANRRWHLNLDALAANMDSLTGWPDPPGRYDGPALFLSGGASDYVRPAHHAAIRAQFPAATFDVLPGTGHWLHAEQPRAVEDRLRGSLD